MNKVGPLSRRTLEPALMPKFPVFSLSGKLDIRIPCFPYVLATLKYYHRLFMSSNLTGFKLSSEKPLY